MAHNSNGFIFDPVAIDNVCASLTTPHFGDAAANLKGYGDGKTVLLYSNFDKVGVKNWVRNQLDIGSCVAAALAGLVDLTKAIEIGNGERSEFIALTSIEHLYRGARLGSRISGDGASVAMAVKYAADFGTLAMIKYPSVDLSQYLVPRCRDWGNNKGYPKDLDNIAKNYNIVKYSRIRSYEEARDSIAAGYGIICGSSYGFSSTCDNDGFAKQNTNWNHGMYWSACRADKPGILIQNSWGENWNKMPVRKYNEPKGAFWARSEDIDKLAKNGDCWAIGQHNGYPIRTTMEVDW